MGGNVRKLGVAAVRRKEVSCRSAIVQLCGEQVVLWRPLVPPRANRGAGVNVLANCQRRGPC